MKELKSCKLFALAAVLAVAAATVADAQTFQVLHIFGSKNGDPGAPQPTTRIAQGRDGNLYTTGIVGAATGNGAAFKITPSGKLTVLYSFCSQSACSDGQAPVGGLTLGTDGNFYGTTGLGGSADFGIVYKMTPSGSLKVLYTFTGGADGRSPQAPPIEGLDGNFYGTAWFGGSSASCGTIYKITPSGTFSVLYTFVNAATDACNPRAPLVLGTDGNFYGTSSYGAYATFKITPSGKYTPLAPNGAPVYTMYGPLIQGTNEFFYGADSANHIFKMSANGSATILYTLNGTTDGNGPNSGVEQASDGNFYGATQSGGTSQNCTSNLGTCGVLFKVTPRGGYTVLHDFEDPDGYEPDPIIQHTNGIIYGQTTFGGGTANAGTFWSWNARLHPFVSLLLYSGKVGSQVGILGQGFSSSSVVKFNGVQATTVKRQGSTFLLATVPSGASDGFVTVTTGATTLTSSRKYTVHNSWASGTAMPTPVAFATSSALDGKIYLVGGYAGTTYSSPVGDLQIYNPANNSWTTGASLPTGTAQAASAVVDNVLYVFGGTDSSNDFNAVWAYDPKTNSWSSKANIPTARRSLAATVYKNIIYVIGGYSVAGGRLNTVEAYDPATNSWTEEASMLLGKSEPSVGTIGTAIVAADGYDGTSDNGDNEAYNTGMNSWSALKADPKPRNAACSGVIGALLYVAGGGNTNGPALSSAESYSLSKNAWTSLARIPHGALATGSAVSNGLLYCIGGWASSPDGTLLNNVQIYQP
jgi:uncharacterized repeat protein (TIGR03803 family)